MRLVHLWHRLQHQCQYLHLRLLTPFLPRRLPHQSPLLHTKGSRPTLTLLEGEPQQVLLGMPSETSVVVTLPLHPANMRL